MITSSWRITKKDCYQNPIKHIYCQTFVSEKIYENLYEQYNNFQHSHWQKFISENKVNLTLHYNIEKQPTIKKEYPYVGYWFFKQRTDQKRRDNVIKLINSEQEKIICSQPNAILIVEATSNILVNPRQGLMTLPFCEIYFDSITNEKIKSLLN